MTRTLAIEPVESRSKDIGETGSGGDEPRVDGAAIIYRLYDVGYAISLEDASALLGEQTRGRVRPLRVEARAIQIRNPPLVVALGDHEVVVGASRCSATLTARLFDFGVCSFQLRVDAPAGLAWSEFTAFANALAESSRPASIIDVELPALLSRIRGAIERPALAPISEDYRIYRIGRITAGSATEQRTTMAESQTDERLVALLVGEHRRLATTARRELIPYRFSYYDDDLAVLSWESALVIEPRVDDHDIEYVLEFANAQLLELRVFDLQLDEELPALYDRVEAARARSWPRSSGRFRGVLSDLQTRVADVTETVERVENALKVTNDVYLARVYTAALDLFREQAWRRGIDRKLAILRETYAMLNGEAQAARMELLEIAVIVLILAELVLGIVRR